MTPAENEYRKYLSLIQQRKFLFAAVAVLVCTVGIAVAYILPEKYEAKSTVFIEKSMITDLVEGLAITQSLEGRLKVLTHILSSRSLLQKVVDDLDVDLVDKDQGSVNSLIKDFQKNTQVTISGKDLFIIQYASENPRLARDYVNTLIQKYIEQSLAATRQESYGANRFLAEQMEHFRRKIKDAEDRLGRFKQQEHYAVYSDDSVILGEIAQAEATLEELEVQKNELLARKALLNRGSREGGTSAEHLASLQRKRDQLLLTYTENYPEVLLVNAEIDQIRKGLGKNRGGDIPPAEDASVEGTILGIQLSAITARDAKLRKSLEENKAVLAVLPEKRKVYNELVRDRDVYKNTYDQLVLRHGRSELSTQMEMEDKVDTFRIVDPAILSDKPMKPNRVPIILISLAAGVVAGFGVIFLLDYLDSTVKTIDSVQTLGLPILALIPQFTTTEEHDRQRKQTMALTAMVGVYLLGVFLVLALEVLQLINVPAVEEILRTLHLRDQVAGLAAAFRNII